MAKRHPFKKTKPGEPIPVTARQLESFILEHNGRFNSRDLVEKDILVRNMVSNLDYSRRRVKTWACSKFSETTQNYLEREIDAQKKVIF